VGGSTYEVAIAFAKKIEEEEFIHKKAQLILDESKMRNISYKKLFARPLEEKPFTGYFM
jgi:hypothetical protein